MKDTQLNEKFPLIVKLARFCLTFPHITADVERIFSIIGNIKNDVRNRLST